MRPSAPSAPRFLLAAALALAASAVAGDELARRRPLRAELVGELCFGTLVAGHGGGSLTLSAQGARSTSGALASTSSSAARPARLEVTGEPGTRLSLLLPAEMELESAAGGRLRVERFEAGREGPYEIGGSGRIEVDLGATLRVDGRLAPGSYQGVFSVVLAYE